MIIWGNKFLSQQGRAGFHWYLLNSINNQPDIDKIYLYAKDPYEGKYQFFINKSESIGLKHFNDPKTFIGYSNDMGDVYKNINE